MKRNVLLTIAALAALNLLAQNSFPAPGLMQPGRGSPWGPPPPASSPALSPNGYGDGWQNDGNLTVMANGYDAQGVWRVLPLRVEYAYNGIQYDVKVINAWNPWSDTWDYNVDIPAANTSYYLRGNTYDFYAALSTGIYYFNL